MVLRCRDNTWMNLTFFCSHRASAPNKGGRLALECRHATSYASSRRDVIMEAASAGAALHLSHIPTGSGRRQLLQPKTQKYKYILRELLRSLCYFPALKFTHFLTRNFLAVSGACYEGLPDCICKNPSDLSPQGRSCRIHTAGSCKILEPFSKYISTITSATVLNQSPAATCKTKSKVGLIQGDIDV